MRLTLWKQSQKKHAFTNLVYVDKSTFEKLGCPKKVLLQGKMVQRLAVDTSLSEGKISVSKLHREALNLSESDIEKYDLKIQV